MIRFKYLFIFCFQALFFTNTYAQYYVDTTGMSVTEDGLLYKIIKQGNGKYPDDGDRVWVHYYAMFENDSVYDSTEDSGVRDFYLGSGQLIKAWEEGLKLVDEGGVILIVSPPELAYGAKGNRIIPPNSTLIFKIALVQVDKGKTIKRFDTKDIGPVKDNTGLEYYIIEEGEGATATDGDNVYIHYTAFLPDGSIFDSSKKKGDAVRVTVGDNSLIEGWDIGLHHLKKGGKAEFVIPPELAFGDTGYSNIVSPGDTIILDVEMVELLPPVEVNMIDTSGYEIYQTESGLRYVVVKSGEGDLIKNGDIVEVNYSGFFTDGTLFDSSVKRYEPIKFPVGQGFVIKGWEEALLLMRKGAFFHLIVPANLAYGKDGNPPLIAPDTDLVFDIEVLDVISSVEDKYKDIH